jgi:hypothetical protein
MTATMGPLLAGNDLGSETPRLIRALQSRFNGAIGSVQNQESEMSDLTTSMPAATPVAASALESIAVRDLPLGAHLVTPRLGYAHHGIYVGGNKVVHYAGLSSVLLLRGPVEEVSLEEFADGREVSIKTRPVPRFAPPEVVARARSRLGEDRYRLTTNNCEHFCEWCLSGESRSEQVERIVSRVRAAVVAASRRLKEVFGIAGLNPAARAGNC